jgi:hypothetical protein
MVPAMEGDRLKCYPEKTLLTEAALGRGVFSRGDIILVNMALSRGQYGILWPEEM